jgi:calcineurin-like phosphoesterase family protein
MKTYIITDTHFFHTRLEEYCNRPKNATELIIKNWKKTVTGNDLVIHLGDVIFKEERSLKEILDELPGRKILVLGNHDSKSFKFYNEHGFDFTCLKFDYKHFGIRILFSHHPRKINYKTKSGKWYVNIHGHMHTYTPSEISEMGRDDELINYRKNNIKVALEEHNYQPILLDTIISKWKKDNGIH